MKIQGVLIPVVTPFINGEVDLESYGKIIKHYTSKQIAGIMPLATTGETPTLTDYEYEALLSKTIECNVGNVPVYVGFGGNNTGKMTKEIKKFEKFNIKGILSVCPYYNRPDQRGIYEHFKAISEATPLDIVLYNIPYRTGRNIENDTVRKLSELKNIVGIKDACGDFSQTTDLLLHKPSDENFSILTGEDAFFYSTLMLGGDGGVMASAHINTDKYIEIYNKAKQNDHEGALKLWREVVDIIPMLFKEPNPAPVKHCLYKQGLIKSSEVRLPLVPVSEELAKELDAAL